jgi:hypothetical protein
MPAEVTGTRRFPPPWDIEEHNRSNKGQASAYVYFQTEPGRRTAASLLTRDESRRIQHEMAAEWLRLADVVRRPGKSKQMQMG